ncbi:MAG: TolB family protein, partial [Solirubrobacterales bacterium]
TFCNNRADTMLLSIRSSDYGSSAVIVRDGEVEKVGTKFGYASWHPNGRIVAYMDMKVVEFLHPTGDETRDVIDLDSLLAYYDAQSQKVGSSPELAKKDRLETYPTWSPDGRYLYFCSAPRTWTTRNALPEEYAQVRYDLMRIPYDPNQGTWGQAETVLAAKDIGKSILLPRISPDGRWLLVSMCDYGCFPVYQKSSDLYLIDLQAGQQTGRYEPRRLEINSDQSESWHSWSSTGRWIAFSSKRDSGLFTRTYLSYVDPNGAAHKPFVLPQEDPTAYDSCLWTYSVPELIVEPVHTTREALGRVVRGSKKISVQLPITMATPKVDTTPQAGAPYLSGRE